MKTFVTLALIIAATAAASTHQHRIVGGSPAAISQYPSIVALLYTRDWSSYAQECGGSILNVRSILTAAKCFEGDVIARWRVRAGSSWANSGGQVYNSQQFIIHPEFNQWSLDNNIAILRIEPFIVLIPNAAQVASISGPQYVVPDNDVVWAAGWGSTFYGGAFAKQLRHVQIWAINHDACRTRYASIGATVTDNMLCSGWLDVGGRDQCQGDAGGPLYHGNVVVGISSWGEQCGLSDFPGVNTRVSSYTSWIQANA